MCTVLLPPGGYPIAVNKYIKSLCDRKASIMRRPWHTVPRENHQSNGTDDGYSAQKVELADPGGRAV